jgi:exopolysaccharide production protein ExoZ
LPTLLQGWTLNIEMFFYLVVAGALCFPRRIQLPLISIVLLVAVVSGALLHPQSAALKAYSNDLLLEFIMGLWVGRLCLTGRLPGPRVGLFLLAFGLSVLSLDPWINHSVVTFRALYWGMPAVLIVFGALSIEANGGLLKVNFFKTLGDASFSIYLLHDIVVASVGRLPVPVFLKTFCALGISVLAGMLAFKYFERPLNAVFRKIPRVA